jgi:hypothetical protein
VPQAHLEVHLLSPAIRLLLAALAVAAFSGSPAIASEEREFDSGHDETNSIHAGATSVQLLTLGGGTNGIFVKCHFSDRGALRVGTTFDFSEQTGDNAAGSPLQARRYRSYNFTGSAEIQEFVDATGPVVLFVGFGPFYSRSYGLDQWTSGPDYFGNTYYYARYEDSRWLVGGGVSTGFEWFFKRKLSVIGRVGASLGFGKSHNEQQTKSTDINGNVLYDDHRVIDSDTISASTSNAALGLGVHF